MSSVSFLITIALNSVSDSWLAPFSVSTLSETSSFPFIWGLVLCLPTVCETLLVSLCFINWSVLTPCIYGKNFYYRMPMEFSGAVSLISWARWSWAVVYVGSPCVFGFWLLLDLSLMGLSLELVNWGSLHLSCLVFYCADVDRLRWRWFFCVYKVLRFLSHSCSVVCSE